VFLPAVEQATVAYRQWLSSRTKCFDEPQDDKKPPPYKHVKAWTIALTLCCMLCIHCLFQPSIAYARIMLSQDVYHLIHTCQRVSCILSECLNKHIIRHFHDLAQLSWFSHIGWTCKIWVIIPLIGIWNT